MQRNELEIFERVCDADPAEREALLLELCGDDSAIEQRVRKLLEADLDPDTKLEQQAIGFVDGDFELPTPRTEHDRISVPGYRILRRLGEGGMGIVYEAEQESPRRKVALKVIRSSFADASTRSRFEHESRVLGWLNHRGIAQVYEAGTIGEDDSQPYFAMELVEGLPVNRFVEDRKLSTEDRLGLVARICDALHHAHMKGVIHRDLKPGNILVDSSGQPKILDFGIARVTDSDLSATTRMTSAGEILGTLPYMSPEQLLADPSELDTRSDVYSMGVVAYQLLSGELPLDVRNKVVPEAARIITEEEPTTLGARDASLRGDIEVIVSKAVDKEKTRRYASAEELASDIRRYLRDEPIVARRATTMYQFKKFARRNKILVAAIALVFLTLVGGIATSTWLYFEKETERAAAVEAESEAKGLLVQAEEARADIAGLLELAEDAAEREAWLRAQAELSERRQRQFREIADQAVENQRELFDHYVSLVEAPSPWVEGPDVKVVDVLAKASERIDERFADRPAARAVLYHSIGRTYVELEMSETAVSHLERAVQIAEEHGEFSESDMAQFRCDYGAALLRAGRPQEGHRLVTESLARMDRSTEQGRYQIGAMLIVLARTMRVHGYYDAALDYVDESLELLRGIHPETHKDVRHALVAKAEILVKRGNYDECGELVDYILSNPEQPEGEEDVASILAMNAWAGALANTGRSKEAIPLMARVIAGMERHGGARHGNVAIQKSTMAAVLSTTGRMDEALVYIEEAHALASDIWGDDSYHIGEILSNWGGICMTGGMVEEAVDRLREAIPILVLNYGEDHPSPALRRSMIGRCLTQLGRPEEGLEYFETSVGPLMAQTDVGHFHGIEALMSFAVNRVAALDLDRALECIVQAEEFLDHHVGPEHGIRTDLRDMEAVCALLDGDHEEALAQYEALLEDLDAGQHSAKWTRMRLRAHRGLALIADGEVEQGDELFEQAIADMRFYKPERKWPDFLEGIRAERFP